MIKNNKFLSKLFEEKTITQSILYLSFILFTSLASAQAPSIEWQKSFGGSSGEQAECVKQTSDGGYVVAGYTRSNDGDVIGNNGEFDYWIIKISASSDVEWKKTYGGTNSEYARSIYQTTDGGYIIAGISDSNDGDVSGGHGGNDYWILKLSTLGDIEWQKSFGGSNNDVANIVKQTTDGGYIIGGFTNSIDQDVIGNHGGNDYWIIKLSSNGNVEWKKTFGGTNDEFVLNMAQSADGGYVIAGYTLSNNGDVTGNHGGFDCWIVKINAIGVLEWQKAIGGTLQDYAFDIQQTLDDGYIIGGYSNSNDGDIAVNAGNIDCLIIKLSNLGNIEWQKTFGGTSVDTGESIQQTSDGGFIVGGRTSSSNGNITGNQGSSDYWILKLTIVGTLQWQKTLGGTSFDHGRSICQTNDNGYIVCGLTNSSNGDVTFNQGLSDFWIVKLFPDSLSNSNFDSTKFKIYPIPTNKILYIESIEPVNNLIIRDINSRLLIQKQELDIRTVDISNLKTGIYFVEIKNSVGIQIKKIIKD
jgi:hypothetical protein